MDPYTPQSSLLSPGRIGQANWSAALSKRIRGFEANQISDLYHWFAPRNGINTDFALAQFCEETGWGTSDRWLRQNNPAGIGITDDSVSGHVFSSPVEGIIAHLEHLCCYAYSPATCPVNHLAPLDFRHLFHDGIPWLSHLQEPKPGRRWAEKEGYVGRILAIANSLLPKEQPTMSVPKPPIDTSRPSPNRGYSNAYQHEPQAIVWHVTAGGFAGSLSWLTNPASQASANYLIDKDGSIYQLVPPTESAWANGAVNKPDLSNPLIAAWNATKGLNFNQRTVSIETTRETSANEQPGGFTEAQHKALVALSAWLCDSLGIAPDRTHIIRHAQIDSVNRLHCPGLAESEMVAWIGQVAALVNQTPAPAPSTMLSPIVTPALNWGEGSKGRIVSVELTAVNDDTGAYYASKKQWEADGSVTQGPWREV